MFTPRSARRERGGRCAACSLRAERVANKPLEPTARIDKPDEWHYSITMKMELVTTLKRQATRLIAEIQEDRKPVLITEHGRPAAYLVDVQTFDEQQNRIQILEGIARGERAVQENRTVTHDQARKRMERWLA